MASKKAKVPAKVPAKVTKIEHLSDGRVIYHVPSQTQVEVVYGVSERDGQMVCPCKGFQYRGKCAHLDAAMARKQEIEARREAGLAAAREAARKRDTAPLYRSNAGFSLFKAS